MSRNRLLNFLAVLIAVCFGTVCRAEQRERVVYVGAHPDDSYGGVATMILLAEKYDVHLVDFTHGERGLGEAGFRDGSTKAIRTAEEENFARALGIRLHWLDEIDGEARSGATSVDALVRLLRELKPRAVFMHWPVDVHKDHVNCSAAVQTAATIVGVPELYFFEVPFVQTRCWRPTYSVDVTDVFSRAMAATRLYRCQGAHYLKSPQAEVRGNQRRPKSKYAETFSTFDGARIAGGVLESLRETAVADTHDCENGRLVLAARNAAPRCRLVLPNAPDADEMKAAQELERCLGEATEVGFSETAPHAVLFERAAVTDAFCYRIHVANGDLHIVSRGDGFLAAVHELVRRFGGLEVYVPGETKMPWMSEFYVPATFDETRRMPVSLRVDPTAAPPVSEDFKTLGVMIDVSRGRVLTVDYLKGRFERMRKMGYNAVMLYTEDTFPLEGEVKWGYMRGGYSLEDIHELKAHADALGLEMIPCIETLGHLEQPLRWPEYDDIRNNASTVVVGAERTYELIDKMLAFWEKAVGGTRIHLNMDEAPGFAEGKCKWLPGEKTRFDVFLRHLNRVNELCIRHGFDDPFIAGDALYRVASKNGEYYEPDTKAKPELAARVPKNVRLVYWDYYHDRQAHYEGMIDGHWSFGSEPILYGGIQNWSHFFVDREKSLATLKPMIAAGKAKGCRELFLTLWGDDGGYGIPDVAEECLFACAELAQGRTAEPTEENCRRFREITGLDYASLVKLADVTRHYANEWPDMIHEAEMLYDDPIYCCNYRNYLARKPSESALGRFYRENGYYCAHFRDVAWRDDGEKVMAEHRRVLAACADLPGLPAVATALVRVLRDKIAYEAELLAAWKAKNRAAIERLAGKSLPALIDGMRTFNETYRTDWYATSYPFGFETIQKRNAGALARLEEAKRRLDAWLGGAEQTIPELDEAMKPFGRFSPNSPVRW